MGFTLLHLWDHRFSLCTLLSQVAHLHIPVFQKFIKILHLLLSSVLPESLWVNSCCHLTELYTGRGNNKCYNWKPQHNLTKTHLLQTPNDPGPVCLFLLIWKPGPGGDVSITVSSPGLSYASSPFNVWPVIQQLSYRVASFTWHQSSILTTSTYI